MHPSAQNQRLIQPLTEWIRTTIRHCDSVYLFGSAHSQENTMKQLPTDLNALVLQNTVPLSDFQNQVSVLLCLSLSELHKGEGVESTIHNACSVLQMTLRSGNNSQSGPFSTLIKGSPWSITLWAIAGTPGDTLQIPVKLPPDSVSSLLF